MIPLAFLAGAAGLSLEILWARRLTLETGSPLAALMIALCGTMAGMAAGAAWAAARGDRLSRPLVPFGWLHLAASLPLPALVIAPSGGAIRWSLRMAGIGPDASAFFPLVLALGSLPVMLSGAALGTATPLLVAARARPGRPTRAYARLAAAQAAGGAMGSLLCGFVLLPRLGLRMSVVLAAVASATVGAAALIRKAPARPEEPEAITPPPAGVPSLFPLLVTSSLALCGASVTAMELVWTRLAFLSFGSTARGASLVLAAAVTGLAAGSLLGPAVARRLGGKGALSALASAGAMALLVTVPLLGRLPLAGAWIAQLAIPAIEDPAMFALSFAAAMFPCLCMGAVFPAGFAALQETSGWNDGRVARYAGLSSLSSSIGTLAGAPLAWMAMAAGAGSRGCMLASALALGLGGMLAAPRLRAAALPAVTAVAAFAMALGPGWDMGLLSSGPYLYGSLYGWAREEGGSLEGALRARGPVLFAREGPEALVTVRRQMTGALSLQVNGKTDASTGGDMKTQVLVAQLPALLWQTVSRRDAPPRALVIGLGSGVSAGSLLTHGGEVTAIEISPEVVEGARWFETANGGALENPRLRLVVGDARTRLLFEPSTWDLIVSQPSNPWVAGQASLFTREFFALARGRLAPGGVLCQWVQGYGLRAEDFRSVVATFASVFPHVTLWEESTSGGDYLLIGSADPMRLSAEALARAMESPAVKADLARVEVTSATDLIAHFVAAPAEIAGMSSRAAIQSDDRMALEFSARQALREETLGSILGLLEPWRRLPAALIDADPETARALERRASAARDERRWAEGLGLFETTGAGDPDLLRAISYLRRGMTDHARDAVRAVAARRPGDPLPRRILAHLAMAQGRVGEAAEALAEAAALQPRHARTRLFLSRALFAAGRIPAALQVNGDALTLDPDLAEAASDRCALLLAAGNEGEAEGFCRRAVATDPALAEAQANLGVLLARQNRPAEAARAYDRALGLDPGLRDARYNLAVLRERDGDAAGGLRVLQPLLEEESVDAGTLRLAARLALSTGERDRARSWAERSLALEPGSQESAELLDRLR
jgi:spermidine synthase